MDTTRLTLMICLVYGYPRIAAEFLTQGLESNNLLHLVGLMIGAHGLWFWHSRRLVGGTSGVIANPNIPLFLIVLLVISLLADAGTLLIQL